VRAAADFLRGRDLEPLARFEAEMRAAAAARQFERAGALRDARAALAGLVAHLEQVDAARRQYSFVYPVPAYGRGRAWYLIRQGEVATVVRAPRAGRPATQCLQALEEVFGTVPSPALPARDDLDTLLLTMAWFRRHPAELARTLSIATAGEHCRSVLAAG
jgi:hypothetical protein